MILVAVAWVGLVGALSQDPAPGGRADSTTEYQQVRASWGRSPTDQVRLALWCESHGLTAERVRHLALAVLADPTNTTARGLLGLVQRDGRWVAPDALAAAVRADPARTALLSEYDARRSKTAYTADAQWALGLWADEQGLPDQARAHFTVVSRLDPSRDAAWKRLGYRKHDGGWATDGQIAAAKAEADAQKAADKLWRGRLERWRSQLAQPSKRREILSEMLGVTDPRAVSAIARVFGTDKPDDQLTAVRLLGQIVAPEASRALAILAVSSRSAEVRRLAVETLRQRDPRDFVGLWVHLIRSPIKYEVQPVGGPGQPGSLTIVGQKANTRRVYRPLDAPDLSGINLANATLDSDSNGLAVIRIPTGIYRDDSQRVELLNQNTNGHRELSGELRNKLAGLSTNSSVLGAFDQLASGPPAIALSAAYWDTVFPDGRMKVPNMFNPVVRREVDIPIAAMARDAQNSALTAQAQMSRDVAQLDQINAATHRQNDPVISALIDITQVNLGEDARSWSKWWTDQQGYAITDDSTTTTPTLIENVPIGSPTATPVVSESTIGFVQTHHSCFAAGTTVRTIDGSRPIETIQRGDQVLVQDTRTGALAFQPVLTAFHNPPSGTFRVRLGDDEVVATGIHRFWRAGQGWAMARDLKPGDTLRVLGGVATVLSVEVAGTQPVFNLEVADGRSFFVGRLGALVHDNSLVEATPEPFDAPVAAAATPVGSRAAAVR